MEEESWGRNHGGDVVKEESWRNKSCAFVSKS